MGTCAFCHETCRICTPSLGPQNATGSVIAPNEIIKSNSSNMYLQTNPLSPPQSPQSISQSHLSGDHTYRKVKYLEQLLDSSLATVAVIQFSGNTLADVLTPRAYETFKALYALADLDAPALTQSTKNVGSEILSTFSHNCNDCPYSINFSPLFPNSSLAGPSPRTGPGRIHISISVDHVIHFLWAGLVAVSFFVLFSVCF